jgi:hypothetical protein
MLIEDIGAEAMPAVKNGTNALKRERCEPLAGARVIGEGVGPEEEKKKLFGTRT